MQLKLDEIICVLQKADDKLINIEDATDDEISEAKKNIKPEADSSSGNSKNGQGRPS